MTAQEYIKVYKMDHYHPYKFDYEGFLQGFGQEFENQVKPRMSYMEFKSVVSNMNTKFQDILVLRKKRGRLSNKFFKVFYAMYVVPKRRELFPERQAKIDSWVLKKKATNAEGADNN